MSYSEDINSGTELRLISQNNDQIIEKEQIESKNKIDYPKYILLSITISLISCGVFLLKKDFQTKIEDNIYLSQSNSENAYLSEILKSNLEEITSLMPKKPKKLTKIFSSKDNGCYASKFHEACDDKGPTLIIVFNSKNITFAAYTEESWKCTSEEESFKADPNAFVMNINNKEIAMAQNGAGIFRSPNNGPCFGKYLESQRCRNYDYAIKITDDCENYPLSFTTRHEDFNKIRLQYYNTIAEEKFSVKNYEVFQVEY
ncbi:MAG: TLD domain-containing protein [archaeon]|nr:TLD domain-containing protein [archaeon]